MKKVLFSIVVLVLLGFAPIGGMAAEKPILVGAPLSLGFNVGYQPEMTMRLAVEEINAAGGVNVGGKKRPIELVVMDTRDNEPGVPISDALLMVEKIILEKGVDFLVGGPVRSEASLAAMDVVARYKKPHILAAGSISPGIGIKIAKEPEKYRHTFRISGDARWHARSLIGSLMKAGGMHGLKKIFFIVQDAAYARAGTEQTMKILKQNGWEVSGYEVYPMGSSDFSSAMLKAKAAGPGVLLAWMELPEGAILAKQWYDMKVPSMLFGAPLEVALDPKFLEASGGKGDTVISIATYISEVPSEATPWTAKYLDAYMNKYKKLPEASFAGSGYMSIYILKDAIERAGTTESEAVIKALEQTDMMGIAGRVRFKDHDLIFSEDPKEGTVAGFFQWQNGKRVVIAPAGLATGQIKLPAWMTK
ncbi:MAG: ABC transporter substrate-binding protein [Desulfobacterales bacterium]|nr:ABC transporter substrate-binding protein [Desulfobacterales bacterium]